MVQKKYWLINVIGIDGYSMVIHCGAQTEDEAISTALFAKLFNNSEDCRIATAEEADDDTFEHFNSWGDIQEL